MKENNHMGINNDVKINTAQLDKIIADLYYEFYEQNKELFKTNAQEYARQSFDYVRRYKREKIEDYIKSKDNKN